MPAVSNPAPPHHLRQIGLRAPGIFFSAFFVVISFLFSVFPIQSADVPANWLGGTGNWTDATKWSTNPRFPNNGRRTYAVVIDVGDVTLNQDITVNKLTLGQSGNPNLEGTKTLTVNSDLNLNQGLLTGNGILHAFGTANITGNANLYGWPLNLHGDTTWSGRLGAGNGSFINLWFGGTITLTSGAICTYYIPENDTGNPNAPYRNLFNHGTINANAGNNSATLDIYLNNSGVINVNSGSLILSDGGSSSGGINVAAGATLDFEASNIGTSSVYNFTTASSIAGAGSVKFGSGTFTIAGGYNVATATRVGNSTVNFVSSVSNVGNSLIIEGQFAYADFGSNSVSLNSLNLKAGTITGSGIITVNNLLEWNDGSMRGAGTTIATNGVFFNGLNSSSGFDTLDRRLDCYGSSSVQTTAPYFGNLYFGVNAALTIMPGATFNGSRLGIQGSSTVGQTNGTIINYGTLVIDDPSLNRGMVAFGTNFQNNGAIQITNSSLDVRTTIHPGFSIVQEGGSILLNNGKIGDSLNLKSGSLRGYGSMGGNIVSNGLIAPAGGTLNFFQSTLTLQTNSVLSYDLGGTQPGVSYGQMINVSTATFSGALHVGFSNGFQSQINSSNTFTLLSAHGITGQFANVASGSRLTTVEGRCSFLVDYSGTSLVLSNFQPNTFGQWESAFFTPQQLSDPNIGGANATPQQDGITNLLKYLFDINPSISMSVSDRAALPFSELTEIGGARYLTLTYRKNPLVTGVTINLQASSNVETWQTVNPDISQTIGSDPATGVPLIRVGINVTGLSKQFIRLNVTQP